MSAHQTTDSRNHELNVRMLRYRHRPEREEPALLARELLHRGRHADALELTELALTREPDDCDLELVRAQALLAAGETARGEASLIRVAKAAPQWAAPLSALTRVLSGRGDEARASKLAVRARTLGADDTMVGRLAEREESTRKLDARVAHFRADDGSEEPVMLARALEVAGRGGDALSVLRVALERDREDADTLAALARMERGAGRVESAVALYREARAMAPGWDTVERALFSLVGEEIDLDFDAPESRSVPIVIEPSIVVDARVYVEAQALDLDAELDALMGKTRGDATIPFGTERRDTVPGGWTADSTTLVGAPAIARTTKVKSKPVFEPPRATRSNSGFPTRPIKRTAGQPSAYVRVIAGDARRHVV